MEGLRFIKYKQWDVNEIAPFWELPRWLPIKEQTIVAGRPSSDYLGVLSTYPVSEIIHENKIPNDLARVRYWLPNPIGKSMGIMGSDDLVIFGHFSKENEQDFLRKSLLGSVATVLNNFGVVVKTSPFRENANDLYISVGDKRKKCFGCGFIDMGDWYGLTSMLTFDIRIDLIKKLWRLDTEKIKSKGEVKDMADIVGGLDEVSEGLDKDKILEKIVNEFGNRLGLSVRHGNFSSEESDKMNSLVAELNSDDWFFKVKRGAGGQA